MSTRYESLFKSLESNRLTRSDHAQLRAQNLGLILRKVWAEEETSRARLAKETGLSRSAVSALVDTWLDLGFFAEGGSGVSTGGRKPTILRFNYQVHLILGIDLGATHITMTLCDLNGITKASINEPCDVRNDPSRTIQTVNQMMSDLLQTRKLILSDLLGVGLAVPSPVHPETPGRLSPFFMPKWTDIDVLESFNLSSALTVKIDNDANAGALAEAWWGAGKGSDHLAFIKLGTGVGAGFIVDGKIFRGHGGLAGEMGHIVIDPQGEQCVCGLRGCLTTLVGTQILLKQVNQLSPQKNTTHFRELLNNLKLGDPNAREVVSTAGEHLGLAIAGLMNMMNPERVILGGELAQAGDTLLHPLREKVQSRSLWSALSDSRILSSSLGDKDIALGAATMVLQAVLTQPQDFLIKGSSGL